MTKEYIDREALVRYTEKQEVIIKDGTSIADAMRIQGNVFRRCVETIRAADVVEVVRCKDCKYGRPIDKTKEPEKYFKGDCIVCECWNVVGDKPTIYIPHHFCSYGEREERG